MTRAAQCVLAASAALVLSGSASMAQQAGWEYRASVYAFMASTDTTVDTAFGSVDSTLSFRDALEDLDFAFMGTLEASNGRWGVIGDYLYFDLSLSETLPGPAFSGVDTSQTIQIFNGYVTYRLHQTARAAVDLAAGFRWFDTDTALTLRPGAAPGATVTANDSWVDPLIGIRGQFRMSDRWVGTTFLDFGGNGGDSTTWQALATVGYEITDAWSIRGGYRYISVEHDINGNNFEFDQSGPMLGVSYTF